MPPGGPLKQDLRCLCFMTHCWPWERLAPLPPQAPGCSGLSSAAAPLPSFHWPHSLPCHLHLIAESDASSLWPSQAAGAPKKAHRPCFQGNREGDCLGDELGQGLHRESRGRSWLESLLPQREPCPHSPHSKGCSDLRCTIRGITLMKSFLQIQL